MICVESSHFWDQSKFDFEIKKKEFVRFLAQSSQYAPALYAPAQYGPAQVLSLIRFQSPIIYGIIDSLQPYYTNHKLSKEFPKIYSGLISLDIFTYIQFCNL